MATTATATALQSWEEAFTSHPLPAVRGLERELRKTMADNHSKLRALVGTSYRELLGTAERIIEMDVRAREAESLMGEVGTRCHAGVVERVQENYGRMRRARGRAKGCGTAAEGDGDVLAQIRVLKGAIALTGRVVRRGGDALLGAKVCVLGRLLWKGVAESVEEGTRHAVLLEDLKRKLTQARKRLLTYIARSLVQTNAGAESEERDVKRMSTVHTLCAYSLLTSSAPHDVLRYFLQVRFAQMESKAEGNGSDDSLLEMLHLYSQTLLDTRDVFPRRLSDALSQLSKMALMQDADVSSVPELSLDVYAQWIAEDVRNFHPWVRHDQLTVAEVSEAMGSWTKQAHASLLQAISGALQEQADVHVVLDLRRKMMAKYLSLSARIRSDSHVEAITDLRTAFLARLEELACDAATISGFDLDARPTVESSRSATMWNLSKNDVDLNGGAVQFRTAVMAGRHGRHDATISVITSLNDWTARLRGFSEAIASMKATKWDDDLDLDLDELSEGAPLDEVLGKQDAQVLESTLRNETTLALRKTYSRVEESSEPARNPITLVRILREMDTRRRALTDMLESPEAVQADASCVAQLHRQIAAVTAEGAIQSYSKRLRVRTSDSSGLWDGTPPLPVQPAPGTFRFLKMLQRSMSDAGSDIWSPGAVRVLKMFVNESLSHAFAHESRGERQAELVTNNSPAADDEQAEEQHSAAAGAAAAGHGQLVQELFDVLYLRRVLATGKPGEDPLGTVAEALKRGSEVDASSEERLGKSADEYWKRTYLLFGLLAEGHAA